MTDFEGKYWGNLLLNPETDPGSAEPLHRNRWNGEMLISYFLNEFGLRHQLGHVLLPACESSIARIYDVTACFQRQRSTEFFPREWPLPLNVHSLIALPLA